MKASSVLRSSSVRASYPKSTCCLPRRPHKAYLPTSTVTRYGLHMTQVETVRGRVDVSSLGTTLMHEHVFVLNEEIRRNYPAYWDEEARVAHAVAQLDKAVAAGITTIADPTVIGLGRDIGRIKRIAQLTKINIIVATGLYTFNDVPFYFRYRG